MEKMLELLEVIPEVMDPPNPVVIKNVQGYVEFENVRFGYSGQDDILRGISFKIPKGTTVALVGPSGGGKSTIMRLLLRFYDVCDGRILIDGYDIRQFRQKDLRDMLGVVPQETVLFNDTVKYNIRYGKVHSNKQEVLDAAKAAQIHEKVLEFHDGYNTRVGERGLRLSGGEKQRVAIARAFLKNPPIILLDEATSALDTHTERNIQIALREISQNKTTLIIAHRLSTIVSADQILVLKDGEIVESGRHEELLRNAKGFYSDLWWKQSADDHRLC